MSEHLDEVAAEPFVIDSDSHVMEPADLWQEYLEPAFRDRAIRIFEQDGIEHLEIAGQVVLSAVLGGLGGAHVDRELLFTGGLRYADGCPEASYEPAARAKLWNDWGVDSGVLFPTIGILPVPTEDLALASAYARAYNTWQADFASGLDGRAIPIANLNYRDVDEAVRELDRCLALGFRGVFLPPELVDGHRPGDGHFDPILERCAEAGIPACLHVIVRFDGAAVPFEPWLRSGDREAGTSIGPIFTFGLGAPGQIIPALASMVTDGVFDRIPKLKVLCVEAGCGWAAWLADRLDEKQDILGKLALELEMRAGDYLRRNVYWVAEPAERSIGAMLDIMGEDRILWGSDYPHVDSTLEAPKQIRDATAKLTPRRRAAVLGGNAAAVFGIQPKR